MILTLLLSIAHAGQCTPSAVKILAFTQECAVECGYSDEKCTKLYNELAVRAGCEGDYQYADMCAVPTSEPMLVAFLAFLAALAEKDGHPISPVMSALAARQVMLSNVFQQPVPPQVLELVSGSVGFKSNIQNKEFSNAGVERQRVSNIEQSETQSSSGPGIPNGHDGFSNPSANSVHSGVSSIGHLGVEPQITDIERGFLAGGYSAEPGNSQDVRERQMLGRKPQVLDLKKYLPGGDADPSKPRVTLWTIVSTTIQKRCKQQKLHHC